MKLWLLIGSCLSLRDRRDADTSLGEAEKLCKNFYEGRNDTSGTKTSRLGGGGQSVVYKCETNDESSDLSKVVIKMYMRPWEFNMTEREIIDTNLGELKMASKVYQFFYNKDTVTDPKSKDPAGKIEDFLTGKDIDDVADMAKPEIYKNFAIRLAQLHATTLEEMPVPYNYLKEIWPWNTNLIEEHLNQEWWGGLWGWGARASTWKRMNMNTSWDEEVQFAVDKVAESSKLSGPVFCHNDPHNGNIMIDRDENGAMVPETLVLFDFDNAGWGHRAWDIDYYFSKWPKWPSQETMFEFAEIYTTEYNKQVKNNLFSPQAPVAQKIADEVVFRRFQSEGVDFLNRTSLTPLRFLMRIFWKIPI